MPSGYRLTLMKLECLASQEIDGDELYITLNGRTIWRAHPDKASHLRDRERRISAFDFANGRKLAPEGWRLMTPYNPSTFVLKNLSGESLLQIWDADALNRDDLLGETPISAADVGRGSIAVVFQRDGGHYRLTYRVDAEQHPI